MGFQSVYTRRVKLQAFGQVLKLVFSQQSAICIIIIVGSLVVLPAIDYLQMLHMVISRGNM